MKRKDINHFSTSGDTKSSVIERFNRTLKQRMYRYFTSKSTLKFVPVLQDLVEGYNRSYHRFVRVFREIGWKVGLSSITLPMSNRTVRSRSNQKRMKLTNPFLFRFIWYEGYTEQSKRDSEHSVEIYNYGHQAVFANSRSLANIPRSGTELMNEIRNRYLCVMMKATTHISSTVPTAPWTCLTISNPSPWT